MKKLAFVFLLLIAFLANAQTKQPVKWTAKSEKKSATEYVLTFNATIEAEWHMYSQFSDENGAIPMLVTFNNAKNNYELIGKTKESKTEQAFNDVFGVTETFWKEKAQLTQTVKLKDNSNKIVQVTFEYQVCKEVCIQDTKLFQFDLEKGTVKEVNRFEKIAAPKTIAAENQVATPGKADTVVVEEEIATPVYIPAEDTTVKDTAKTPIANTDATTATDKEEPQSAWSIFLLTLLAGIGVTFTPCVFPLIPMTVSFFLKQNTNKSKGKFNALFYGFCIIAIYVLLSLPFHLVEGLDRNIFADISTNVYLNLFFFAVFITFAISFFGAFEITMPNSLASKADNASNAGGLIGIFFMALTLIIVSFSCTGPALSLVFGSVLSQDGGAVLLSLGMFGFGLGLAFPFMIFALFPSLMSNLPKSGGWLNTVKVVFGFIELALAFKFLSNADLVLQLHLLNREVFLAIWIACFGGLTLYLFGKFSTPHDTPLPFLSVGRMLLALLSFTFTIYLIPGLWGAPLKIISGITPPLNYSESPQGFNTASAAADVQEVPDGAVVSVHGIVAFEDYDKGLAYAKKVNKPVMLDFTGRACTNCRKTEEYIWPDPEILSMLKKDVVLISLYCDQNTDLPENEVFISKYSGRDITTIGKKWSDFQVGKYNSNARPFYVLMNLDETNINTPITYTPDVDAYRAWMKDGLSKFKK
jgi:thiol:disulfide interchange protein